LRLSLTEHPEAADASGPNRVAHELDDGRTLVWELGDEAPAGALLSAAVELDDATEWLMRCDRVDFEPGGIAYRHTHPGPGIRYLLFGAITIDSLGAEHTLGPGRLVLFAFGSYDSLAPKDGAPDKVDGGAGFDIAEVDAIDTVTTVELLV